MIERRKHPRFKTLNFVYYVVHKDGSYLTQDMGRTLDASEKGLLMETRIPLVDGLHIKMDIGFNNSILNLGGEVVHSHASEDGMYLSGIEFDPMDTVKRNKLMEYLQQFEPKT